VPVLVLVLVLVRVLVLERSVLERSVLEDGAPLRNDSRRSADRERVLDHERLDVYQCAIQFVAVSLPVVGRLPRGYSALAEQFRRAATSIPLNIAEATGRTGAGERAHPSAVARGSAMECAATLDVVRVLGVAAETQVVRAKELAGRLGAMLTRLCR
jgi:four helix bundle protein